MNDFLGKYLSQRQASTALSQSLYVYCGGGEEVENVEVRANVETEDGAITFADSSSSAKLDTVNERNASVATTYSLDAQSLSSTQEHPPTTSSALLLAHKLSCSQKSLNNNKQHPLVEFQSTVFAAFEEWERYLKYLVCISCQVCEIPRYLVRRTSSSLMKKIECYESARLYVFELKLAGIR